MMVDVKTGEETELLSLPEIADVVVPWDYKGVIHVMGAMGAIWKVDVESGENAILDVAEIPDGGIITADGKYLVGVNYEGDPKGMVLVYNFVTGEEMWVGDLGEGETIFEYEGLLGNHTYLTNLLCGRTTIFKNLEATEENPNPGTQRVDTREFCIDDAGAGIPYGDDGLE